MKKDSNGFLISNSNTLREIIGTLLNFLSLFLFWEKTYEFWFDHKNKHNRKILLKTLQLGKVKLISRTFDFYTGNKEHFKVEIGTEIYLIIVWHFSDIISPNLSMIQMNQEKRESLIELFIGSEKTRKIDSECYRSLKMI
jgi:hypothetical protein